jgi:hypothetical protein
MKDHRTSDAGEPVGAEAQCKINPPRRILVVDGDRSICQLSVEVLIRHETKLLVKNTSITRRVPTAKPSDLPNFAQLSPA